MVWMLNLSKAVGTALVLVAATSCSRQQSHESAIVRLVKAHGSGDLSGYSAVGLQQWFATRPDLAKQVAGMCQSISQSSTADWGASVEGTACGAAQRTIAFVPAKITADQRAW